MAEKTWEPREVIVTQGCASLQTTQSSLDRAQRRHSPGFHFGIPRKGF